MEKEFIMFASSFGVRRSKLKKRIFCDNVQQAAKALGYSVAYRESKSGPLKLGNLYIGDMEKAKTILVAGYDTTEEYSDSYKYYPYSLAIEKKAQLRNVIRRSIFSISSLVLALFVFNRALILSGVIRGIVIGLSLLVCLVGVWLARGKTNRSTFQKTASLFSIIEIMKKVGSTQKNTCFAFLDFASFSRVGVDQMSKDFPCTMNKRVIYLDALASGEVLGIKYTKNEEQFVQKLQQLVTSSTQTYRVKETDEGNKLKLYPNSIEICKLSKDSYGYFAPNTRTKNDLTVDIVSLEGIIDSIVNSLKGERDV